MKKFIFSTTRIVFNSGFKESILNTIKNHYIKSSNLSNLASHSKQNFNAHFKSTNFNDVKNMVIPSLLFDSNVNQNIIKPSLQIPVGHDMNMKDPPRSMSYGPKPLLENLMDEIQGRQPGNNKVTVVGCGCVGIACAVCLLQQKVTNDVCIVDRERDKTLGEITDLGHGSTFLSKLHLKASTDYEASAGSKVCVITAGTRRKQGESRLELLERNIDVIKTVVPPLLKYSPNTILILATNPVDILSNICWKISGLPKGRVIGSGCELDTSRFRYFISEKLGIAPASCHGWIIGEHGDHSVPVWSSVNVAGVKFMDLNPTIGKPGDPENWADIHKKVVSCAGEVLKMKGHTAWAIAMCCTTLTHAVLNNLGTVHSVCVRAKDYHEIKEDIFLSLPASIGINGVNHVIKQTLTKSEIGELHKCAKVLEKKQASIKI